MHELEHDILIQSDYISRRLFSLLFAETPADIVQENYTQKQRTDWETELTIQFERFWFSLVLFFSFIIICFR